MIWLMVAMGGAAGSVMRYGAQRAAVNFAGQETVLGTLAVNLTGSFALGFLATLLVGRFSMTAQMQNFLTIGVLGGFTTFSALSYQTVYLMEKGVVWPALISLLANVVMGLAVAFLGVGMAKAL